MRPQLSRFSLAVVGIVAFAGSAIHGGETPHVFYSHTSGPPPGDGFVWGGGNPEYELLHGDTFKTPDAGVQYRNFTGWPTYFSAHYFDALENDLEQSGHIYREAWWGSTGSQDPELNLRFTDTPAGGIETLSFDLAWATLVVLPPDTVRVRVNDYLSVVPAGPKLEATLDVTLPDAFKAHTYSQGRAGRVELDFRSLIDDRSGAPLTRIEDVWIELDAISEGLGSGHANIVAIDNVSIKDILVLAGDYNQDGFVDAADYVVWRDSDGSQHGYDTWRANFGRTASAESLSGATMPEPANWLLLITASVFVSQNRRRSTAESSGPARASASALC